MNTINTAYIALGANINKPRQQIQKALLALEGLGHIRAQSHFYRSLSILAGQPDYINAAICLETTYSPTSLLNALQSIENKQGRIRNERWGSRCIDLDIILFNDERIESESLTIPHIEARNRLFVLQPLIDINPELTINSESIITLANQLSAEGLEKIS